MNISFTYIHVHHRPVPDRCTALCALRCQTLLCENQEAQTAFTFTYTGCGVHWLTHIKIDYTLYTQGVEYMASHTSHKQGLECIDLQI